MNGKTFLNRRPLVCSFQGILLCCLTTTLSTTNLVIRKIANCLFSNWPTPLTTYQFFKFNYKTSTLENWFLLPVFQELLYWVEVFEEGVFLGSCRVPGRVQSFWSGETVQSRLVVLFEFQGLKKISGLNIMAFKYTLSIIHVATENFVFPYETKPKLMNFGKVNKFMNILYVP